MLSTPSVSNTEKFMREVYLNFPAKTFLIPGNHEQYDNERWREITGFPRQFCVVYGNTVFVMCDTFAGELSPSRHSDGKYTGVDINFLEEVL